MKTIQSDSSIDPGPSSSSKQKTKEVISRTVRSAKLIQEELRSEISGLQTIIDRGEKLINLVPFFDQKSNQEQNMLWSLMNDRVTDFQSQSTASQSSTDTLEGLASISSASAISFYSGSLYYLCQDQNFVSIWQDYSDVVNSPDLIKKIVNQLELLGLDKPSKGQKCPLDDFLIAVAAYNGPVNNLDSSITSLIPLREAINQTIASLLQRCPVQQRTGNIENKIKSIAAQLKKEEITDLIIDKWASDWKKIVDNLSDTKAASISREECQNRFFEALHFFYGFLTGLDRSKFRLP